RSWAVALPPCRASNRGVKGVQTSTRRSPRWEPGGAGVILSRVLPDVSLIVVSHNTRGHLERCLSEVAGSPEVIVVDTGSTDTSQELVRDSFPQARLVAL